MTVRRLVLWGRVFCWVLALVGVQAFVLLASGPPARASDRVATSGLLRLLPDAAGAGPRWSQDPAGVQRWPLGGLPDDGPVRLEVPLLPADGVPWPDAARRPRLPGEFEPQRAILLGGHELLAEMPELYADLIEATQNHIEIVTMVNDSSEAELSRAVLDGRAVQVQPHMLPVPHNTMWARDYGPITIEDEGRPTLIDMDYAGFERPDDDQVPESVAGRFGLPVVKAPLVLEGGNLLSNGRGLCLTTTKVLAENAAIGDEATIAAWMARSYGGAETVFLEPLRGESTGHVDMFATLVSAHVVVVGSYAREQDAENAAVLNRNARRLSRLRVDGKPLKVVRIPMPPHEDGIWRTYTNVVYANGVLLVPVYPGHDEVGCRRALRTYARLLPGWRIVSIDASKIIECGGALHCVTMNMGPLQAIPRFPDPPAVPRGTLPLDQTGPRRVVDVLPAANRWPAPGRLPELTGGVRIGPGGGL